MGEYRSDASSQSTRVRSHEAASSRSSAGRLHHATGATSGAPSCLLSACVVRMCGRHAAASLSLALHRPPPRQSGWSPCSRSDVHFIENSIENIDAGVDWIIRSLRRIQERGKKRCLCSHQL
ncbi:uncharacterized protein LOC123517308 [Portunus trituberculatus]|uniref:uncharacterized protein LOC123517308 n=1 Tax=Portunus trituberculatus TaxID=210409 RepID=UPI001E1D0505|nr:uncharacterized protein LOC123517308 [Portunus trituberculatus]